MDYCAILCQLMVVGANGDRTDRAAKAAVEVYNINVENARTLHQNMVVKNAQDHIRCLATVTQEYVQVNNGF